VEPPVTVPVSSMSGKGLLRRCNVQHEAEGRRLWGAAPARRLGRVERGVGGAGLHDRVHVGEGSDRHERGAAFRLRYMRIGSPFKRCKRSF
jgi:hypothetical protein